VVVNVPIVQNELALRASGSLENLSGYAEAPEFADRKNVNGFSGSNLRLVGEWTPNSNVTVTGMYWRIANAQDFNNGLTPGFSTSTPTISGTGGRRGFTDIDMDLYSATVNWDDVDRYADGQLLVYRAHARFRGAAARCRALPSTTTARSTLNPSRRKSVLRRTATGRSSGLSASSIATPRSTATSVSTSRPSVAACSHVVNVKGPLTTESWSLFGEASAVHVRQQA
jgi:hypothetical protein